MKKRGKRQALPICAAVLAGLLIPANAMAVNFEDVSAGRWYAEPITWAVEQGIASGTSKTTFSSNETCNKAQVLAFLWRGCGSPSVVRENPFTDISSDKYYYKAALWAYENGMVGGGRFDPQAPCTRSMAVTYMWKTAGSPQAENAVPFADVKESADYAQAVAWAVDTGVTSGTSERSFSPEQTCTRAQVMAFLYRSRTLNDTPGTANATKPTQEATAQEEQERADEGMALYESREIKEQLESEVISESELTDDPASDEPSESNGTLEPLDAAEILEEAGGELIPEGTDADIQIVLE